MNTEKIREALESGIIEPGLRKTALAELDKAQQPAEPVAWMSEEFVRARAMEIYPPDEVNDGCPWYGHRRAIEDSAARHMVRHLHKMGYLAPAAGLTAMCGCGDEIKPNTDAICGNCAASNQQPAAGLTVKEAHKAVAEWMQANGRYFRSDLDTDLFAMDADLRARLTAALEAKTRTA